MSAFRKIGEALKEGLANVPVVSTLMHMDVILVFGALAFWVLSAFLNLGIITTILGAFAFYLFLLGLVMCWANGNTQFMYAGLFGYAAFQFIRLLQMLFARYGGFFSFNTLVAMLIYGGLGYLVMTKVKD